SWVARNPLLVPKSRPGDDWESWTIRQQNWQPVRQGDNWTCWFEWGSDSVAQPRSDANCQDLGCQDSSNTSTAEDIDLSIRSLILNGDGVSDLPPSPTPESAGYGDRYHNIYDCCNSGRDQNSGGVLGFFASLIRLIFQPSKHH
ncbi:MAG: hypothetical protein F6K30_06405, partial [Cyanothece sp. SIO2G6]|nr:hypothetical protein [Cyanothece sp. SIO2G6]